MIELVKIFVPKLVIIFMTLAASIKTKSSSKKYRRRNSSDLINEIAEKIEIGILFGEYKPREHLTQEKLSSKYAVERNVIRSTLKKLAENGTVEYFPNRGVVVKEFTAKGAKDLYTLRIVLEGMAAEMAASQIDKATIKKLESLSAQMQKDLTKRNLKEFILKHEKFHDLLFAAANNSYLLKIIKELISASSSIRYFSYSRFSLPGTKHQLFEEHKRIIYFLKKGNAKRVGEIARAHIKAGINHYLKHFFPHESLMD